MWQEFEKEKTGKLQMTKVSFLNSLGEYVGRLLLKDALKFDKLIKLWKVGGREERLLVISALGKISRYDWQGVKQFVLDILEDIRGWEICDQLALKVLVNLAVKDREFFSLLEEWVFSENKWIRRLAIATIPPYIRAKRDEAKVCLNLLDKVMEENDKDVKKAVGWALREITKKDAKSVLDFLSKWARVKNKNTQWIIKDGMKKLPKEAQNNLKVLMKGE